MERNERMEAFLNSEAFEKELATTSSPEDLQKVLEKHGITISLEEIQTVISSVDQGELSAEDLDNVAGGVNFWPLAVYLVKKVAKYIICKYR